jgi:hypothetical protein
MKILKKITIFIFLTVVFVVPFVINAQPTPIPPATPTQTTKITGSIPNPFNCGGQSNCTLMTFITTVLNNVVMPVAAVAVVVWIIWAGF